MLENIYQDLFTLNREMNRLFGSYNAAGYYYPETNIYENSEEYVVIAKVPGLVKDEITLTLKDNSLKISGERKKLVPEKMSVHLSERFSGKFERSFILNDKVDTNNIQAEMNNGLLMIKIPKSPETKPQKIEIK